MARLWAGALSGRWGMSLVSPQSLRQGEPWGRLEGLLLSLASSQHELQPRPLQDWPQGPVGPRRPEAPTLKAR